ncbi:MAG: aldo/keto reductase [Alphaproteobacteria bacterium]
MQYVNMGSTGLKVSRICLGCMSFGSGMDWMISEDDSKAIVKRALDAGINFYDTADVYSRGQSEEILGRALKGFGVARDKVVIATKLFGAMGDDINQKGLSRKHVMHAVDDSLRRLGTDYIDLYQIHRFDRETPIEETLEALTDVVKAGKVRYIGASSMWAWQLAKMLFTADMKGYARFVTMQNHYNLLYREEEREMVPLCRDQGVGLIPWSPLAGGRVAGSRQAGTVRSKSPMARNAYSRPSDERVIDAVNSVAAQRGVNAAEIALAWLLAQPAVTAPIVGITKLAQLEDPIKAVETKLTADELKALGEHYATQPVIGHQ